MAGTPATAAVADISTSERITSEIEVISSLLKGSWTLNRFGQT
jgi:hypothetical protein